MLKSEKMSRMTISGHKKDLADLSKLLNDQNLVHVVEYNNEDEGFGLGKSLDYGEQSSDFLVKLRSVIKLLEVEANPPTTIKLDSEIESEISELVSVLLLNLSLKVLNISAEKLKCIPSSLAIQSLDKAKPGSKPLFLK